MGISISEISGTTNKTLSFNVEFLLQVATIWQDFHRSFHSGMVGRNQANSFGRKCVRNWRKVITEGVHLIFSVSGNFAAKNKFLDYKVDFIFQVDFLKWDIDRRHQAGSVGGKWVSKSRKVSSDGNSWFDRPIRTLLDYSKPDIFVLKSPTSESSTRLWGIEVRKQTDCIDGKNRTKSFGSK